MLNSREKNQLMPEPILSICIPTYNRSKYLFRLLESLVHEISDNGLPVNIKITNNASLDNTKALCDEFSEKYAFITVVHQLQNMGPDYNISTAYAMSDGLFTWVLGDDEYLKRGALSLIVQLLCSEVPKDMIYISHEVVEDDSVGSVTCLDSISLVEPSKFASLVGVYFSFISSFIFKKSIFPLEWNKIEQGFNSHLVQLIWIFGTLSNGHNFLFVNTKCFFAEADNSTGYRFYEVFSKNYCDLVDSCLPQYDRIKAQLKLSSLLFLVGHTCNQKTKVNFGDASSAKSDLDYAFGGLWQYKFFLKYVFYKNVFNGPILFLFKVRRKLRSFLIK